MRRFFAICTLLMLAPLQAQGTDAAAYHGYWWNEEKNGIFELVETDAGIEGITRWGQEPRKDALNPDPALRDRDLKNVRFLWDFTYDARKNRWKDGLVYDPDTGKTYEAKMSLERDGAVLKMRGYIGVSLFGRTARFDRVEAEEMPAELKTELSAR